jgi:hypothetical protein
MDELHQRRGHARVTRYRLVAVEDDNTRMSPSHTGIAEPSIRASAWAGGCLRAASLLICFCANSLAVSLRCLIASYAAGHYLTPSLTVVSALVLPAMVAFLLRFRRSV